MDAILQRLRAAENLIRTLRLDAGLRYETMSKEVRRAYDAWREIVKEQERIGGKDGGS